MPMSHAQIDRLIDDHFRHEATDDVDGVVASMAGDAEHDLVPSPWGPRHGSTEIRDFYRMLFADLRGESVTPLRRLYGEDFVVDECIWHGRVVDGRPFLCPGRSGPVSFRLLHVFELRDGRIQRENVWCDLASIQRQLGVEAA
jgi:ketosteroid isomerase-like protein